MLNSEQNVKDQCESDPKGPLWNNFLAHFTKERRFYVQQLWIGETGCRLAVFVRRPLSRTEKRKLKRNLCRWAIPLAQERDKVRLFKIESEGKQEKKREFLVILLLIEKLVLLGSLISIAHQLFEEKIMRIAAVLFIENFFRLYLRIAFDSILIMLPTGNCSFRAPAILQLSERESLLVIH